MKGIKNFNAVCQLHNRGMINLIGILASVFIATSLLPQVKKLTTEKQAGDISLGMLIILTIGQILWIIYGVMKNDWIIIISNSFSLLVDIVTLVLSVRYKKNE